MKKALIITTVSGFLLKFEKENVKLLQKMGYEVHYAANGKLKMYEYEDKVYEEIGVIFHDIDIRKSPLKIFKNFKALRKIRKLVKEEKISLIHCHTPIGGVLGRLCGIGNKKLHIIYTSHGYHFYKGGSFFSNSLYLFIEKLMARLTDDIILINKEDYEKTLSFKLKPGGRVNQIPGIGLNLENFKPVSEKEKTYLRNKLGIGHKQSFILSVGELNENKNQGIVIRALAKLSQRGFDLEKIHYGICGQGPDREKLEKLIKEYELSKYVSLYGYCDNVSDYINAADFFVFPSKREGLGMAALEALACGVPVIASDNRGSREYMKDNYNGFVCSNGSETEFADCIERLICLSCEEKHKMSQNCVDSVKKFDKFNTIKIMTEIYQRIE